MSQLKTIKQFQNGEFEIAISVYDTDAVVIIHNGIPGVGTIIKTEKTDGYVDTDVMIGLENQMFELLCIELTKGLKFDSIVFILSFKPEKLQNLADVRAFLDEFTKNINQK
ncbi:hypothetical protein TVAG_149350 [Trichomonas vaginalis G3]|uniref:Proteasome assembly chaperone 3 n=1 Tax=Trichomonas vaginalis (strain ATCC PRA-98 / G3) TaxID=412133 RepID=A2ELK2_TRIV3|nr:hypothetical protein TVAGG3_0163300 [Trichomonas vaginalis G3]EAY06449.1 hypothetical protein TVAG_149350 [Trichomonas vaginalis G3]KAI5548023.1 hypothetical protein TVAGG3_0163300 [Trichomonas vaginalis G3]|eukprot:XP_001318672.1 hypothetical protein [Trichomonas vaginalis G3]